MKGEFNMNGTDVAQSAKKQLAQLTGLKPDTVSGMIQEKDGWHITVEMIELKRIPDSTDVLGTYESLLDDAGQLIKYKRLGQYCRSDTIASP
jgi:hypothetical protein